MRIAMISTPFLSVPPHDYGGTELVVYELVEGLLDRGHDVTLFATGDSHTRARLRALYPSPQWPPGPFTDLNHISWAMSQAFAVRRPPTVRANPTGIQTRWTHHGGDHVRSTRIAMT